MIIIDGKKTSLKIKSEISNQVSEMKRKGLKPPCLAAVIVGEDGASMTYVKNKVKACHLVGFRSSLIELDKNISERQLLHKIDSLNKNPDIDGFIVQLPLPKNIDEQKIILAIDPNKDVDGFHPVNVGRMVSGLKCFIPATPYGVLELLNAYNIATKGKNIVVIGRSHIVGRPLSILLSQKICDGTVSLLHSQTPHIKNFTLNADIIITALGIPKFLTDDMIGDNCCIIDVGITRVKDDSHPKGYKLCGDVDFESVSKKAKFITPVPGGVGPMTIAMLLKNTLLASKNNHHSQTTLTEQL